jgi:hypothetical protein
MSPGPSFSRRETESLLDAAVRVPSEPASSRLTLDELTQVAAEAGIEAAQLDAAIRARGRRRARFGLVAIAVGVAGITAALVLGSHALVDSHDPHSLRIENEHARERFQLEVLVPVPAARAPARCADPPADRVPARDYCRLVRTSLAPGARLRLMVPDAPQGCPQAWVRAIRADGRQAAALFTLPASVEIERTGGLDQKGVGSPNMHAAPAAIPSGRACSEGNEGSSE